MRDVPKRACSLLQMRGPHRRAGAETTRIWSSQRQEVCHVASRKEYRVFTVRHLCTWLRRALLYDMASVDVTDCHDTDVSVALLLLGLGHLLC